MKLSRKAWSLNPPTKQSAAKRRQGGGGGQAPTILGIGLELLRVLGNGLEWTTQRREKKLMTMEEVNEQFPITKYKQWRCTREEKGLPTAGGITAPPSRAASMKDEAGVIQPPYPPAKSGTDAGTSRAVAASPSSPTFPSRMETTEKELLVQPQQAQQSTVTSSTTEPKAIASAPHKTSMADDEDDEDVDQIQPTVPADLLPNPGDTCAICLDIIEDDDDIRGLSCGHAFHASCVDPWLTSRKACCPLCKADYYIAKPRNEGPENDEGSRTRGRGSMPAHPPFAFLGGPATRFGVIGPTGDRPPVWGNRTRLVLPGRMMAIVYAGEDRRGHGPHQAREPTSEGMETGRRWSRSRSAPNAPATAMVGHGTNNATQHDADQGQQRRGSTWRNRLRSIPNIGIPMFGGRSRSIAPGANAENQQQHELSPGQMEAGNPTTNNNAARPTN